MQKRKLFNILRVLCYCLGFPLLFLIGLIASMPFFGEPVYADSCANGILILLGIWAIVEIVRFSMKFALKKHRLLQTIITIIVAIVVMAVPMFITDAVLGKQFKEMVADNETITVSFNEGDKIYAAGTTVTLTENLTVPAEYFNAGFATENYEYQVGWHNVVTNTSRRDKALYWQLIYDTDIYMYKTGINKWLNFNDYKFNNYEESTGDGLALGVASTIKKEINTLKKVVAVYYYQDINSLPISEELQSAYDLACGKTSTSDIISSGMSLSSLYQLQFELETRPSLYPFLAVRNYIYIFIGIVTFVYILIYFLNEKYLACNPDEIVQFKFLNKFRKENGEPTPEAKPAKEANSKKKEEKGNE